MNRFVVQVFSIRLLLKLGGEYVAKTKHLTPVFLTVCHGLSNKEALALI